ncbi:unnamed protein product [Urochloa humidicola]
MPATTGADVVACEYDGVGVALEFAAVAALVVLLRYATVLYANHLIATLSVDDGDFPAAARRSLDDDDDGRSRCASSGGLDAAAIARLPFFVSAAGGTAKECAVCLSGVEEGETARALPCCTHTFHARCVDAWLRLRPTCPVCRATCR